MTMDSPRQTTSTVPGAVTLTIARTPGSSVRHARQEHRDIKDVKNGKDSKSSKDIESAKTIEDIEDASIVERSPPSRRRLADGRVTPTIDPALARMLDNAERYTQWALRRMQR
ncbi:hypothetical protein [Embleya sp. NPDC020886]|uniref:hypothetical protein n=1 Tax=Embleya sp. NPDC020886 TaxID=3363980 RepID=UPI00379F280F